MSGEVITPDDLDFTSQLTLQTLLNHGGKATAGYLKEQTDVEQTQQIHYRCDPETDGKSELAALGFVEPTGERESWNGHPSKVYRLTDAGEEYALGNHLDLAPELHRGQLEDALGQVRDHVSAVETNAETAHKAANRARDDVDALEERVQGWESEAERRQQKLEKLDELEERLNNLNTVLSSQEVNQAIRDLDKLEGRVEKLEREVGIEDAPEVDDLEQRVSTVENNVNTIWNTLGMNKMRDWGNKNWSLAKWVEDIEDYLPDGWAREDDDDDDGGRLNLFNN